LKRLGEFYPTYIENFIDPAIPATAAADENPAAPAIPAKDAVHVMVPFKELLHEKWPWDIWNKHEECSISHENVSENASESVLPIHVFNCNIASNNHEGKPWHIYLGPLLKSTAFRASIVSDPDIWQKHPPVKYKTIGDATFIASEFLDRNEFDALDRELNVHSLH